MTTQKRLNAYYTISEHLNELRNRLLVASVVTLILSVSLALSAPETVLRLFLNSAIRAGISIETETPHELIIIILQGCLIIGFVISLPIWVYQIWRWTIPGLTRNERTIFFRFIVISAISFQITIVFFFRTDFLYQTMRLFSQLNYLGIGQQWQADGIFRFSLKVIWLIVLLFQSLLIGYGIKRYGVPFIFKSDAKDIPGRKQLLLTVGLTLMVVVLFPFLGLWLSISTTGLGILFFFSFTFIGMKPIVSMSRRINEIKDRLMYSSRDFVSQIMEELTVEDRRDEFELSELKDLRKQIELLRREVQIYPYFESESVEMQVVVNTKSKKFHLSGCHLAGMITETNQILIANGDLAVELGYTPCKLCYHETN